jgi:hypothetical protein
MPKHIVIVYDKKNDKYERLPFNTEEFEVEIRGARGKVYYSSEKFNKDNNLNNEKVVVLK